MIDIQQLITAPERWAFRRAMILCNLNRADAEDLVQDMLYQAYKNRDQFKRGNLDAWLATILYNRRFDIARYTTHKKKNLAKMTWEVATYDNGETRLEAKLQIEEINRCLNPTQRKIMYLTSLGYKSEEIAKDTGRPDVSIRGEIFRARKKIKNLQL